MYLPNYPLKRSDSRFLKFWNIINEGLADNDFVPSITEPNSDVVINSWTNLMQYQPLLN